MLLDCQLPRCQFFEFHDLPWFPPIFRNALTEWLRAFWEYSQAANVIAPLLAKAINQSGVQQVVDLCSGGSGPIIPIQRILESFRVWVPVLATDKFPDPEVMGKLQKSTRGRVTGSLRSVDATALPHDFTGFRTLFNAFHHFTPAHARQILSDAYKSRQPIGIFEMTERSIPKVLLCFPASFLGTFLLSTRMYPRRATWWFFTWVLPVIPFTVAWDGLMSHLRSYTKAELLVMINGLEDETYVWEIGRVRAPRGGIDISFLIGKPILANGMRPC